MASNTRQTNLLVQQDWKKIYQSFQNADFQSYDFETLRKSMIDYIKTYYPEDFNDFLESSEYVALIDLIAFLGQSLSFRADLNARENFLDTAERRDSVLKLARMISYNPKRNNCASGLLRIDSISTTETIYDSTGINLSNIPIRWDDVSNDNWMEQISIILNASFINSQLVGKPGNTQYISNIRTEEYSINLLPNIIPAFKFKSSVEGINMPFELVSPTSVNKNFIYEKDPVPSRTFNILYRNDNLGNGSKNTGWFVYFKQGDIATVDFTLNDSLPNRIINVNVDNINNTDVWLYKIDNDGNALEKWSEVPNVNGYNVIYNASANRKIFQINSRSNDQIDLVFGDGSFSDIPTGIYRLFYRTSNALTYKITPEELQNVILPITYVSRNGRAETLTIKASLNYTVSNSSSRESLDEIKSKAPQQYYTQNRMITGEDYNILPYTKFNNILKIKSTNRSSSGISRYLDTLDITGKFSSTNIFGEDGVLYRQESIDVIDYTVPINSDVVGSLNEIINNELWDSNYVPFSQFIYEKLPRYTPLDRLSSSSVFDIQWVRKSISTNQCTGYFATNANYEASIESRTTPSPIKVGSASMTILRFIKPGCVIRFRASLDNDINPKHFDSTHDIINGLPSTGGDRTYIYATVVAVNGDGSGDGIITSTSRGAITLSVAVPSGAFIDQIIPKIQNQIPLEILRTVSSYVNGKKNFGLRFDQLNQKWDVIAPQNLKLSQQSSSLISNGVVNAEYNETYAGNTSSGSLDSSWIISFVSGVSGYKVYYRSINYVFESKRETKFYFDPKVRVYDSKSASIITDQIKIIRANSEPDGNAALNDDKLYHIYKMIIDPDGYENSSKILIKSSDSNRDGIPDNPDLFAEIVNPSTNSANKLIFFKKVNNANNYVSYSVIDDGLVETAYGSQGQIIGAYSLYSDGQVFYAIDENKFYSLSVNYSNGFEARSLEQSSNGEIYLVQYGRQNLYFQYRHAAPSNRRIDPSPNNIVDLYVLTKQYASDYRAWITDATGRVNEPLIPTTEELQLAYSDLENYKTISDTLIYQSARFKPLFGDKADPQLRATFKVVKNSNIVISDNDIKASVISAINRYFEISNWDFGESFFFSELSAYLHSVLAPRVSSIIIVPTASNLQFGSLQQINAEPDEILISAATVDNVEIISSITSNQL